MGKVAPPVDKFRKQLWNMRFLWAFCVVAVVVGAVALLCAGRFVPELPTTALCVFFFIAAGVMAALLVWASGES